MNKQWWKETVVYQIYPRSFMDGNGDGIGDLQGIISKLDYLKWLGIDVIWLSPVYDSPNDDNGYDIRDYYAIMNEFGTMEDWDEMIDEIHKRSMKLVMDLVVNHTSDEHQWFVESRSSKDSPYRDYYIWRPGKNGKEPNNWESIFSGSAWEYDEQTGEYYLHLFSKKQPDLNWENEKVREEVYKMMTFWLDKGVDGFRMDVINFISKVPSLPDAPNPEGKKYVSGAQYFINGPRIHEFLQEMHDRVLSRYDVMTVGETPGVTPEEAILFTGEDRNELNMVFQFEHMDVDAGPNGKWDLVPLDLVKLKRILANWQVSLHGKGWNSLYWCNHDQPRVVSRFGNDEEYRKESAKLWGTLLHMMQGTPYIYQGEEIGMTNVRFPSIQDYKDIESLNMHKEKLEEGWTEEDILHAIHVKGRDNARTPMQWDETEHGGFTTGTPWIGVNPNYRTINVKEATEDSNSVLHYYRKLIQLRKQHPIVVYGSFELLEENDEQLFVYRRRYENEHLLVIGNVSNDQLGYTYPDDVPAEKTLWISNYPVSEERTGAIMLRPWEVRVYHWAE
ncbi:glycoside hydrolase family 13 protein [Aeribacillus pallidus]|uniref:glycoside hydrolase family 13 protein n=1 Tax=Aeribacillus pallidus TaxID=33936 RepID=UPI003D1EC40A